MERALEDVIKCFLDDNSWDGEIVEPWHSFWCHRPMRNFPPKSIRFPSEYDGGDWLSLEVTQTDLSSKKQRELVDEWCELLPSLSSVRILWFYSKVTQQLFEAACEMPKLKGLYIKWSSIQNLSPIAGLLNLTHLHIGGAPSAKPIDALCNLKNLVDLELNNVAAAGNTAFVHFMPQLKSLALAGDGNSLKSLKIESLTPLEALVNLERLSITTANVSDESLAPIARLKRLKYLLISNQFKMEEFAELAGKLPAVDCDCFDPVGEVVDWMQCKKCGERTMVPLTGKRKPWLCKNCDSRRIEKHAAEFNRIVQASAASIS